jgi:hypothetical protein
LPLSELQKAGVRRHMDFAVAGLDRNSPVGGTLASGQAGYRWNQVFGGLEYRMNNLSPTEEAMLLGVAYAAIALTGPLVDGSGNPVPSAGNTVAITFSGGNLASPHTVTTTAVAGDSLLTLAARIATTVNLDTTMQAAGIQGLAPFGTGAFALGQQYPGGNPAGNVAIPLPEAAFTSPVAFSAVLASSTGFIGARMTALGALTPPMAAVNWTTQPYSTVNGYLPICDYLEGAWYGAAQNMDLAQAGGTDGATFRMDEEKQRASIYRKAIMRMVFFMFGDPSEDGAVGKRSGFGYSAGSTLRAVV